WSVNPRGNRRWSRRRRRRLRRRTGWRSRVRRTCIRLGRSAAGARQQQQYDQSHPQRGAHTPARIVRRRPLLSICPGPSATLAEVANAAGLGGVYARHQAHICMATLDVATAVRTAVLANTYRDSVELMRVAAELESLPGILRAAVGMGTPMNRDVLLG